MDDGSPDGTADVAEAHGATIGGVTVERRADKDGLGSAYRHGFRWGLERGFDVMIEMDADLSHDPADLPSLLSAVEHGADLAIGSRYVPGGSIPAWSWHRRLLSRWGNRYAAGLLGLAVNDATAGYRAYRSDTLRAIDLDAVRADGYGFQIEMTYATVRSGGAVVEVPISFVDRTRGESKMSGRIVVEALTLVTWWAIRDRILRRPTHALRTADRTPYRENAKRTPVTRSPVPSFRCDPWAAGWRLGDAVLPTAGGQDQQATEAHQHDRQLGERQARVGTRAGQRAACGGTTVTAAVIVAADLDGQRERDRIAERIDALGGDDRRAVLEARRDGDRRRSGCRHRRW